MRPIRLAGVFALAALCLVATRRADAGCASAPSPGGSVTWTTAGSPWQICGNMTIPANATVIIQPGAVVTFASSTTTLTVQGTLRAEGTAAAPIQLGSPSGGRLKVSGRAELDHVSINCQVVPMDGGGALLFRDCVFHAGQAASLTEITEATYLWNDPPLVLLDGCAFNGDHGGWEFLLQNAHVALRDTTFTDTEVEIWDSYVYLDQVSSDGGTINLFFRNVDAHQDVYVNNVSASGVTAGPGLSIDGANALLGPDNTLTGNRYAVAASGLLPGSVVPATGNTRNMILAHRAPGSIWSELGLPWLVESTGCDAVFPRIEPGVTVRFGPGAMLCTESASMVARGLPGAPITFEPFAGASWQGLISHVSEGSHIDNCIIEGASIGYIITNASGWLTDSVVRNCEVGANTNTYGVMRVRKSRFLDNGIGVETTDTATMWCDSAELPNSFEGNDQGAAPREILADIDAEHCWWGAPSGPAASTNPGGTGDALGTTGTVHYQPFLTAEPDYTNHPPVVRLAKNQGPPDHVVHNLFETGSKFILEWSAADDDTIVEQHVLFAPEGDFDQEFTLVATLPAHRRSYEWTVPTVGFNVTGSSSFLRVVAVDSTGQSGWDQMSMVIPSSDTPPANVTITSDFGGQTFSAGQALPNFSFSGSFGTLSTYFILLDGDEKSIDMGGGASPWQFTDSPFASTDTARLAVRGAGSINRVAWVFGEEFTLRPHAEIGDAPPSVTLLAPAAGASFPGGSIVPISWSASDDEALGGFKVQASYDGGRTWHVIARDLPAAATSYAWPLPPSTGIPDVRVRVIAFDRRFQNSSDGTNRSFAITAGDALRQPGDANGDGVVNVDDLVAVITAWGTCTDACATDLNGDGQVNVDDLVAVIVNWG